MSLLPPQPASPEPARKRSACTREHCFYAFDTLYCSLMRAKPIAATFADDK